MLVNSALFICILGIVVVAAQVPVSGDEYQCSESTCPFRCYENTCVHRISEQYCDRCSPDYMCFFIPMGTPTCLPNDGKTYPEVQDAISSCNETAPCFLKPTVCYNSKCALKVNAALCGNRCLENKECFKPLNEPATCI